MRVRIVGAWASTLCLVAATAPNVLSAPRAILISWDGAGYEMTSRLLAEGRLPNLDRMVREGAWSDGMVSSFPTKTAAAHALLFTGHYGHTSGITGNSLLRHPQTEHDRLDTESGYFSGPLRVEPIWVRVAAAGREVFALHATQAFPFDNIERTLSPNAARRLKVIHGYTGAEHRGEALDESSIRLAAPDGWRVPESRGECARTFDFLVGDGRFHALLFDDPLDPTKGCDTVGIVRDSSEPLFEARVKSGPQAGFSTPVRTTIRGRDAWFSLRVFDLAADGSRLSIYRSGAAALALSSSETPGAGTPVMEVFAGNSGTRAYSSGGFGPTIVDGGDGTAEARFLETVAHLQQQFIRQARLVLEEDYSLVILYSPASDDVAHELAGYVDPNLDGYDEAQAARLWEVIAAGFELQDRLLGVALEAAASDDAHVVLVSDHGMAGTDRLVHLNIALERAGFVQLRDDRTIDLSSSRALALPLADASIAINTTDRLSGIVADEDRDRVLLEVRRALETIRDPDTGEPVVAATFEPATEGLFQPGGSSTGDLFLDFLPGYYPSTSTARDVVLEKVSRRGNHIFVPSRRSMLAVLAAWGPRVSPETRWGKTRAVDVVPTVLDLLEMPPVDDLPGRSLVSPEPLLRVR